MTTIIFIFILSMAFSLLLTPYAIRIAHKYDIIDIPSDRKVHKTPIARLGGLGIYVSFLLPFCAIFFYTNQMLDLLNANFKLVILLIGSSLVFGIGLIDDIRGVQSWIKLLIQIAAALIAYHGGFRIEIVTMPGFGDGLGLGILSLPCTVFWFVLVTNAFNLIDGLDGLAAGIGFFVSLVLLVICVITHKFLVAMGFAALAGALMGFLRYNFNPASVFLGDCGSYFLGFMLAALSILGSMKSQATVAILIPVIALGVPLADAILAPFRRFLIGKHIFTADKEHLHHRLLQFGITHRRSVLILYSITIMMGITSLALVHARDDQAAFLLCIFGVSAIFAIRKLGYFELFTLSRLLGWLSGLSEEIGLKSDRRAFVNTQMAISVSNSLEELWSEVLKTNEFLNLDYLELRINKNGGPPDVESKYLWKNNQTELYGNNMDPNLFFYMTMPISKGNECYGSLFIAKNMFRSPMSPYTLRRIESLHGTVIECIMKLSKNGGIDTRPVHANS